MLRWHNLFTRINQSSPVDRCPMLSIGTETTWWFRKSQWNRIYFFKSSKVIVFVVKIRLNKIPIVKLLLRRSIDRHRQNILRVKNVLIKWMIWSQLISQQSRLFVKQVHSPRISDKQKESFFSSPSIHRRGISQRSFLSIDHSRSSEEPFGYCHPQDMSTIKINIEAMRQSCSSVKTDGYQFLFLLQQGEKKLDVSTDENSLSTEKEKSRLNNQVSVIESSDIPFWWDTISENFNDIVFILLTIPFESNMQCSKVNHQRC